MVQSFCSHCDDQFFTAYHTPPTASLYLPFKKPLTFLTLANCHLRVVFSVFVSSRNVSREKHSRFACAVLVCFRHGRRNVFRIREARPADWRRYRAAVNGEPRRVCCRRVRRQVLSIVVWCANNRRIVVVVAKKSPGGFHTLPPSTRHAVQLNFKCALNAH